ncbi:adaptin N terminal region-domain-containing protein [Haematococcus lacustris]
MSKTAYMRGLQNFISDIRSAQNKEQEQRRVEKELLKIREKFNDDKALSGYDRRKYVWKLLYIYMLGYRIEFGYKQAADLIPQQKYKDKQVGYMACSLLLQENDEFLRLTLNAIHMDLTSRNEAFETLALSFIGNVGGSEMADALTQDVIKLLSGGAARPVVKKRAALALLRLIRKTNSEDLVVTADIFAPVVNTLLEERDLGLLLSVTTLLQGVCARNGAAGYEGAQQRLIKVLERLTLQREREVPAEYLYYGIPSPWLQCKCLRVLQYFPNPESSGERGALSTILHGIIDSVGVGETAKGANPNKANALHAILFEAISLALHLDPDTQLLTTCTSALGRFLSAKDANVRYLALDTLARLAQRPTSLEAIRHLQLTVLANLKDADVAIRKRASDLLFSLCDASCVQPLVTELLQYLGAVDFSMREEVVLKIAILAEKFAPSVDWYVEVALQLLEKAGDFVSEDLWHRVVQLVTNTPAMQPCAARSTVEVLRRGAAHESLVCSAAYLLGEFGSLVADQAPLAEQFRLLHALFPPATPATKGLLLTAFIKLYLADPGNAALRNEVVTLFERNQKFMDAELQQRAVEYLRLTASPSAARYFLPMPKWQEGGESSLLHRLEQLQGGSVNTAAAGGRGGLDISRSSAGGSLTLGTQGSGAALLPAGASGPVSPRLMLGSPSAAHAPPSKDPLWASGSGPQQSPRSAASGAPLMSQGFTSSAPNPTPPGHPTKPTPAAACLPTPPTHRQQPLRCGGAATVLPPPATPPARPAGPPTANAAVPPPQHLPTPAPAPAPAPVPGLAHPARQLRPSAADCALSLTAPALPRAPAQWLPLHPPPHPHCHLRFQWPAWPAWPWRLCGQHGEQWAGLAQP